MVLLDRNTFLVKVGWVGKLSFFSWVAKLQGCEVDADVEAFFMKTFLIRPLLVL